MIKKAGKVQIHPVILSGGSGTRLWPVSRARHPKQLYPLVSDRTMLQDTVLRLHGEKNIAAPLIIANQEHRFFIAEQLREVGISDAEIVLEPVGRNTAPAIAAAAELLLRDDPDAVMAVLSADHAIGNVGAFRKAIGEAAVLAVEGSLVTLGVVPTAPDTGYGYIKRADEALTSGDAWPVAEFVEKPDLSTAESYVSSGEYYWNAGIFIFRADRYLEELAAFRPDIRSAAGQAVESGKRDMDYFRLGAPEFEACPPDSIDYAVTEKTDQAVVIPVDIAWSDVGSWRALWEIGDGDAQGNVLQGDVLHVDTKNSYLRAEKRLIATAGIRDLVVVETADAVLVAPRDQVHKVRDLVQSLKEQDRDEADSHTRVYRPWGFFETLERGERFQVKRLQVKPGAKLSLQMHNHRAEHWVVVNGTAQITRGEESFLLSEDESAYIPKGVKHSIENPGETPLNLIEVQSGGYLGEDDIVRFEDLYGRD